MSKTLFDKIWEQHVVDSIPDGPDVLYIDRHFIHEVTSPQAFSGLKSRGAKVFRPERVFATPDHNVPTIDQHLPIQDKLSRLQVEKLTENCVAHDIQLFRLTDENHGIVHIIGPELGITQPGQTIVCGDSHTATHGAFGTIAFGIGTSEVEMVFASQCLLQYKPKRMRVTVEGELSAGVVSKDVILGRNVKLSQLINLYGCEIGDNSKIGALVEIVVDGQALSDTGRLGSGVHPGGLDDFFLGHPGYFGSLVRWVFLDPGLEPSPAS